MGTQPPIAREATETVIPRRALISVSDKTGLAELGQALSAAGAEILSTGGTAEALRAAGCAVRDVADVTGFPEMMDGRVKTLHPMIHGGLLADRAVPAHVAAMTAHGVPPIDLLVVNLYPFEAAVAADAALPEAIEKIDIGGPAMIRAAAKNAAHVAVVIDPSDYGAVIAAVSGGEAAPAPGLSLADRRRLAAKAFARTAAYDAAIAARLEAEAGAAFPERLPLAFQRRDTLRYGENPHQAAAFYAAPSDPRFGGRVGVATAEIIQGKALSYNNIADTDAAFELAADLAEAEAAAVVIVKHANPCGAARAPSLEAAYRAARACDPVSAFGGVVALSRPIDGAAAAAMLEIFTEVVIAPEADAEARALFAEKPNVRLMLTGGMPAPDQPGLTLKTVSGGLLAQDRDIGRATPRDFTVVTKRAPTPTELADLAFAWTVGKHVKSNAIVYASGGATVGVGAGQMSRVDSARIAAQKAAETAGERNGGGGGRTPCVAASDAFFPFADGLEAVVEAGATAVAQPGGSMRDAEVIAAADAAGIAMVFTGRRHFRH